MCALRSFALLLVALLGLLALSRGQTNLVQNPSFELPRSAGQTYMTQVAPYWYSPSFFDSEAGENRTTLFIGANTTYLPGPSASAYDGLYSIVFEGGSTAQLITQAVPVTASHQYVLSFFLMFPTGDTVESFAASYQFSSSNSATQLVSNSGFPIQPPFWWTQFNFTLTAGASDTFVNLTFAGRDPDYGFLLDYIVLYDQGVSGSSNGVTGPGPVPAITPNPSNNVILNGDFELGTTYPWSMPAGDNPFPISNGPGAYDFTSKSGADGCPQGNFCFVFGGPYSSLPLTGSFPVSSSNSYTLSFIYGTPGGYNASVVPQYGSLFAASYAWGSGASTYIINEINATLPTNASNPLAGTSGPHGFNYVSQQLGNPPSGTTTINIRFDGYSWPTWYTLDYIVLTATSSPNYNSAVAASHASAAVAVVLVMLTYCLQAVL